jgi:hypothetical protein
MPTYTKLSANYGAAGVRPLTISGYVSADEVIRPDTQAHIDRVTADGGSVPDPFFANKIFAALASFGIDPVLMRVAVDYHFGVKLTNGAIQKFYSLAGANSDCVLGSGAGALVRPGLNGVPTSSINGSQYLTTGGILLGDTNQYAWLGLFQIDPSATGQMAVANFGYYCTIAFELLYGYMRATHQIAFTGGQCYIPNGRYGNGTSYDGAWLRAVMRWEPNRDNNASSESQVYGNGYRTNVYAYDNPRGSFTASPQIYLGNGLNNSNLSNFMVFATDEPNFIFAVDRIVRRKYKQAS